MSATPDMPLQAESDVYNNSDGYVDSSVNMNLSRKDTFKRRWDSIPPKGANLVMNRKSLNVETSKRREGKIQNEN